MLRPRVKPEHAPYRISGGRIRLGGVSYGIAAEVKDPTGSVWTLLGCMDGTRTVEEIVARVLELHPDESAESVRDGVELFIRSGYVEDAASPDPAELTERDKERYGRGRMYFRWLDLTPRANSWEPQLALRRARVTVVGVGGTGGIAALALAASGVGRLHCVDHDTVELSNLNRQVLYGEEDIGLPKVEAAVRRLRRLNSDIEIDGRYLRIQGVDDVVALAEDCDVLLLAADRPPELRIWTNRACLAAGRPWVDAGYHGPVGSVGTYVPGVSACWECLRAAQDERHRELGANRDDAQRRSAAVANAVAAPSAGISGYLAAHAVLGLLTGVAPIPPGRIHGINLSELAEPFVLDDLRRPDCPGCGESA
ncbi:MAG: ThiF family adenylyltransferase [Streptosporangiales bacterium]|nr:ThiF family adenylyltransferase [Streptosporangiales bacterium]